MIVQGLPRRGFSTTTEGNLEHHWEWVDDDKAEGGAKVHASSEEDAIRKRIALETSQRWKRCTAEWKCDAPPDEGAAIEVESSRNLLATAVAQTTGKDSAEASERLSAKEAAMWKRAAKNPKFRANLVRTEP